MGLDLKTMRKQAEMIVDKEHMGHIAQKQAQDIIDLIDELERVRKVHQEEQGRAADRLRKALAK